ncbi:sperm-associated antigen 8 isoform X2 [Eublepharis macularius]|uniref:Sperm-associated antigen 8 isoform X2 n=1 Tax=Eublepharis macularius TaxID=481883 RepID=A0AA97JSY0_EUBMA|nr:sperm-associated antigen 8 isoform X2 [Eublepharis macularius]
MGGPPQQGAGARSCRRCTCARFSGPAPRAAAGLHGDRRATPPALEGGMEAPGSELAPGPEAERAAGPVERPACAVELPPCPGRPGPVLAVLPPRLEMAAACAPPEPPPEPPARGHCLLRNWQEERATNHLDHVPSPRGGTEGFFYRHGHQGLLTLQDLAGLAKSTTMKDSYQRPWRMGLPARAGGHDGVAFVPEIQEVFEKEVDPPPSPMDSLSTTHRDYRREGFLLVPPSPTKPHDYRTEQPRSFWLAHAQQVPGVSSIRTDDTPFKKCATFTTPVTECLDQPMPYGPENYPKL